MTSSRSLRRCSRRAARWTSRASAIPPSSGPPSLHRLGREALQVPCGSAQSPTFATQFTSGCELHAESFQVAAVGPAPPGRPSLAATPVLRSKDDATNQSASVRQRRRHPAPGGATGGSAEIPTETPALLKRKRPRTLPVPERLRRFCFAFGVPVLPSGWVSCMCIELMRKEDEANDYAQGHVRRG